MRGTVKGIDLTISKKRKKDFSVETVGGAGSLGWRKGGSDFH